MKSCLILLLATLLLGCSSTTYKLDYARDVDFSKLRRYQWNLPAAPANATIVDNDLLRKRIIRHCDNALQARGYVNDKQPDFTLTYRITPVSSDEMTFVNVHYGVGYYGSSGPYHYPFATTRSSYRDDDSDMMLIIDISDSANQRLIWRGWRRVNMTGASIPEGIVQRAVTAIVSDFPPPAYRVAAGSQQQK